MTCPAILTGSQFLTRVLSHVDCQAAFMGTYGWQALAQPGSLGAALLTGLLTLFIALFGVRLLFGPTPYARDLVADALKVGIVLTLAFSWPAFRTVIHDVVLEGPGEIAITAGSPLMPEGRRLTESLQQADDLMLRLIEQGTGRQTGAYVDAQDPGGTFRGQALEDENSFGLARLFYLSGILGSYGLLRIVAGFLLAIAPIAAGMLLFEATRGLFSGWLRALALSVLGAALVSVVTASELAILLPWLTDALRLRSLGYATPAAPTELLALTLGFAIIQFGAIWLIAKIAFNRGWISLPGLPAWNQNQADGSRTLSESQAPAFAQSRSQRLVDHMETQISREQNYSNVRTDHRSLGHRAEDANRKGHAGPSISAEARLGSSWRRTSERRTLAGAHRDKNK